ncbi:hypothetical protein RMSM_00727 [Rhodopirellula maiorica SM1]|uniref:Uncharacterized protein n=1 Tax=Rhodopirellula maiorica SM1 TaxID=1265738 RepID=M5RSU3_9BACT|nr:hypothetical protein [Rhodopirellula maiorica]EMI22350.1 hypothetical protein RMSM_00727 [Rhodopirellula maiorica SM1]
MSGTSVHPLHFRYVSKEPRQQTRTLLFQLLGELDSAERSALLRDTYTSFQVCPTADTEPECFRELATRLGRIAKLMPNEQPFVFGLVCYVLGNALDRSSHRIRKFITAKKKMLDFMPEVVQQIADLREEECQLHAAYHAFCETDVAGLLDDTPSMDFGSEWLVETEPSGESSSLKNDLNDDEPEPLTLEQIDLHVLSKLLFPYDEELPDRSGQTAFLDQLSAALAGDAVQMETRVVVRVGDRAIAVGASDYCGPSGLNPDCPKVARLRIGHVTQDDVQTLAKLGLTLKDDSSISGSLEFSVLQRELLLLVDWTVEWIRGQESESPVLPPLPIQISGDADEDLPQTAGAFVRDMVAAQSSETFSNFGSDWREHKYLWSRAAREAYNTWEAKHGDRGGDDE